MCEGWQYQQLQTQLTEAQSDSQHWWAEAHQEQRDRFAAQGLVNQLAADLAAAKETLQAWVNACNGWQARAAAAEQREAVLRAQLEDSAGHIRKLTEMISAIQADLTNATAEKEEAKLALKRAGIFNTGLANGLDAMVDEARACPSHEYHPLAVEVEINVNGVPDSMAAVARIVYADQDG